MTTTQGEDRIWVFASILFAIFLLFFSAMTIRSADVDTQKVSGEPQAVEEAWPANSRMLVANKPADRRFLATAYSDYGITKSGVLAATGIVAADPTVLPIGTIIEVEAGTYSGIYTVMDTGPGVKGEKIDIFIPDYDEAVRFGMQKVAVRVLRHGWNPRGELGTSG